MKRVKLAFALLVVLTLGGVSTSLAQTIPSPDGSDCLIPVPNSIGGYYCFGGWTKP